MKKILILILATFPAIVYAQGTVIDTSFFCDTLGFSRSVVVYLPEGYNPNGTVDYPVVYFLHGYGENHHGYPVIYTWLNSMIAGQLIYPVIVVKPDGSIGPYEAAMYTNSELYGNFEDYIVYDLVEFIDSNFRTIPEREKRCIMGHSMGGYGCMKMALKHSDLYRGVASHSGVLDIFVFLSLITPYILAENGGAPPYHYVYGAGVVTNFTFTMSGAFSPNLNNPPYYIDFPLDNLGNEVDTVLDRWVPHNPANMAAQLPPETDLAIYFDCGQQDEVYCYPPNLAFRDSLDLLSIDYLFRQFTGGHALIYSSFYASMTFLDSVMSLSAGSCDYVVGDANNSGGYNGLDVTYGVAFFKGGPAPPYVCECTPYNYWYVAGDVNGSCSYNGLDVTYGVAYFKGGPDPIPCADCPPVSD